MSGSELRDEIEMLRQTTRRFIEAEILPNIEEWRKAGEVDRSLWRKAGAMGLIGASLPEEYGGGGGAFAHEAVICEELARADIIDFGAPVQALVLPYLEKFGTEAQKREWLPRAISGDAVLAVGMTEPSAGSDLQAMRTTARRDGDDYVINGQKVFISNGGTADLIIVAAKTDAQAKGAGISLLLVEADRPGFRRGRKLDKIGLRAADTSELFFEDVRVPAENLLGGVEGQGFRQLKTNLPQERMLIACQGLGHLEAALDETIRYTKERMAFGQRLFDMQNTRFLLAECATEARIARVFVEDCIEKLSRDALDATTAAMAKWWVTDRECAIIDRCLQMFGGYGFMTEYPIARMYMNARAQKIYGGANEIMKELVARSL